MFLVDTSVWIETFKKPQKIDLTEITDLDQVATCLPVLQEVLQGFRDPRPYEVARDAMLSLPMVESPLSDSVFLEAVGLYRSARRRGITVRSSVDCLIAACAIRNNLEVLHRDRDFTGLAEVSSLLQRSI